MSYTESVVARTRVDIFNLTQREMPLLGAAEDPKLRLYFALTDISELVGQYHNRSYTPKTVLGGVAKRMMQSYDNSGWSSRATCWEAEARYVQSLECIKQATEGFEPATLLIDETRRPVAFKKNRGERSTLILRSSVVYGNLPPGLIVTSTPPLDAPKPIPSSNPQLGLVQLADTDRIRGYIQRPATFVLSPRELRLWDHDVSDKLHDSLKKYGNMANHTDLAALTAEADELALAAGIKAS